MRVFIIIITSLIICRFQVFRSIRGGAGLPVDKGQDKSHKTHNVAFRMILLKMWSDIH